MQAIEIRPDLYWLGAIDWSMRSFHGYATSRGSSYNAYLILDDKITLIDTVKRPFAGELLDRIASVIDPARIDYIVSNHAEPDHSGSIPILLSHCPHAKVYTSDPQGHKALAARYGDLPYEAVKTGDTLSLGRRTLHFVATPMLHWPDSMVTYCPEEKILFSNDAFGQHYAVEELFDGKADPCLLWKEAMKYYANILTPFSPMVTKKLAEIGGFNLPIEMIAPSHGAIWAEAPARIVEKYAAWADAYQEDQVTVAYDTMWEGTAKLAHAIAQELHAQSPETVVKVFNISKADKNEVMTEVFKSRAIAVGSPTVSNSYLSSMAGWLEFLKQLKFRNKKAAAFGCHGWSGEGVKLLQQKLKEAGFTVVEENVRSLWNPGEADYAEIPGLARALLS